MNMTLSMSRATRAVCWPQAATHTGVLLVTGTFVSLAQGRQSRHHRRQRVVATKLVSNVNVLIVLPSIAAETERRESFCACRSSWLFSGHEAICMTCRLGQVSMFSRRLWRTRTTWMDSFSVGVLEVPAELLEGRSRLVALLEQVPRK